MRSMRAQKLSNFAPPVNRPRSAVGATRKLGPRLQAFFVVTGALLVHSAIALAASPSPITPNPSTTSGSPAVPHMPIVLCAQAGVMSSWVGITLSVVGIVLIFLVSWVALGGPARIQSRGGSGPKLLSALPVLAALGLVLVPYSPDLCDGRWIPIDELAMAILVGGAFLGFLYGLPAVDTDALKAVGETAGTFTRPSTKLDKITDTLVTVATGGILTYALTQGAQFS